MPPNQYLEATRCDLCFSKKHVTYCFAVTQQIKKKTMIGKLERSWWVEQSTITAEPASIIE